MERRGSADKENEGSSGSSPSPTQEGALQASPPGYAARFLESFKRDPHARLAGSQAERPPPADHRVYDVETAVQRTADSPLERRLKGRHLQMIAIGGSIGNTHISRAKKEDGRSGWD
jgi:yeast amino acid transporter